MFQVSQSYELYIVVVLFVHSLIGSHTKKPQNPSNSKIVNNFRKNYFFTLIFYENVVLNSPKKHAKFQVYINRAAGSKNHAALGRRSAWKFFITFPGCIQVLLQTKARTCSVTRVRNEVPFVA